MPGPVKMSLIEQILSYLQSSPQDVELPNEMGMMDPRLPNTPEAMRRAFETANTYAAGQGSPTERLRAAGLRAARKR